VPYRRFSARLICKGLEKYGKLSETETDDPDDEFFASYRSISDDLSAYDVHEEEESNEITAGTEQVTKSALASKEGACPARTTVFSWVDYVCKKAATMVQQIEKELILRGMPPSILPLEKFIVNKHAWKAGQQPRYMHQQGKQNELNKLSYGLEITRLLVADGKKIAEELRTYFMRFAERCVDILSDTAMVLSTAQSSEQSN
jgi:hypothetical protein